MKKILLSAFALCATMMATAQNQAADPHAGHDHAKPAAVAKTEETIKIESVHDFGKIPQGKPVTYDFVLTNVGKEPIKINNVQASCGCTTPAWDRENAVAPGTTTKINVGFNAAAEGPFSKNITLNYGDNQTKIITIKGEVFKTPAASAPETKAAEIKE